MATGGATTGWPPSVPRRSRETAPLVVLHPRYPREALADGIEGWVELAFTVAPDGSVHDAVVTAANPRRVFDRAALRAIARWKFRPRIEDGVAIPQEATQRIDFRLEEP